MQRHRLHFMTMRWTAHFKHTNDYLARPTVYKQCDVSHSNTVFDYPINSLDSKAEAMLVAGGEPPRDPNSKSEALQT